MKKKLINRLLIGALLVTSVLTLGGNLQVYAAEQNKNIWVYEDGNWRYYDKNGMIAQNTTITYDNKELKFDENGNIIKSEKDLKIDEEMKVYDAKYPETNECSEDYKKRDDRWTNKDDNWYFAWKFPGCEDDECADKDCWDQINGYWYHFNKDGVMDKNATIKDEVGNDCVLNSDGVLTNREQPEFKEIEEGRFNNYSMKTVDGNTYFMNDKGEKAIGWIQDSDNKWYYMNKEGIMQKDKVIIEKNKHYVLGFDGAWIQ